MIIPYDSRRLAKKDQARARRTRGWISTFEISFGYVLEEPHIQPLVDPERSQAEVRAFKCSRGS
jgi:hypothetical protein